MADAPAGTGGAGGAGGAAGAPAQSWWASLVEFYHGVMAEMNKVTWPDMQQVRSATIAIIIFVLLLGLFITALDFIFSGILIKLIPSMITGGH